MKVEWTGLRGACEPGRVMGLEFKQPNEEVSGSDSVDGLAGGLLEVKLKEDVGPFGGHLGDYRE